MLADLFGLSHFSEGEGGDRHIVLTKDVPAAVHENRINYAIADFCDYFLALIDLEQVSCPFHLALDGVWHVCAQAPMPVIQQPAVERVHAAPHCILIQPCHRRLSRSKAMRS